MLPAHIPAAGREQEQDQEQDQEIGERGSGHILIMSERRGPAVTSLSPIFCQIYPAAVKTRADQDQESKMA